MSHTKGKLTVSGTDIYDSNGVIKAQLCNGTFGERKANAHRFVDCWNTCIESDALTKKLNAELTKASDTLRVYHEEIIQLKAEVERLRDALRPFAELADGKDDWKPEERGCAVFPSLKHVRTARAAIGVNNDE